MPLSPEVAGAIVGGAIGIASATVTAGVHYYTTKRRLRAKDRRRLAEFYLDKKVEALSQVHADLTSCYSTLGTALQDPSDYSWDRVRAEIHGEIDGLEHAVDVSAIYLTAEQETALRETVEEYRSVADKIAILETGRRDMIDEVFEATERAGGTLAEEINRPIRRLEAAGDRSGGTVDSEASTDESVERRKVPGGSDSGWAVLATQRDRIRNVLRVADDGAVEFLVDGIEPEGRAMFAIIGRRYAYERDLVESPTVAESELRGTFEGSGSDLRAFLDAADALLMSDDDEYYVEPEDIEGGIDWAAEHVDVELTAED